MSELRAAISLPRVDLRTLVSRMIFPLTLGGAVVAALVLLQRGVAPNVTYLGPQTVALVVIVIGERWLTHRREWLHSRGDVGTDAAFALTVFATMSLARMLGVALAIPLGGWLSESSARVCGRSPGR